MHAKAERIAGLLDIAGLRPTVRELPDSTRTAAEAAEAIGTTIAQIAKSLVFVTAGAGHGAGRVVLVVTSGLNRVDVAKVAAIVDAPISRPDGVRRDLGRGGHSARGVPVDTGRARDAQRRDGRRRQGLSRRRDVDRVRHHR